MIALSHRNLKSGLGSSEVAGEEKERPLVECCYQTQAGPRGEGGSQARGELTASVLVTVWVPVCRFEVYEAIVRRVDHCGTSD